MRQVCDRCTTLLGPHVVVGRQISQGRVPRIRRRKRQIRMSEKASYYSNYTAPQFLHTSPRALVAVLIAWYPNIRPRRLVIILGSSWTPLLALLIDSSEGLAIAHPHLAQRRGLRSPKDGSSAHHCPLEVRQLRAPESPLFAAVLNSSHLLCLQPWAARAAAQR